MRKPAHLAAIASMGAVGVLLSQQAKRDSTAVDRSIEFASKQLVLENSKLTQRVNRDKPAIREAYYLFDQISPSGHTLSPDDSLVEVWKTLRTGDNAVPAKQRFGSDQFLRYTFAYQNSSGKLTDDDYVTVQSKLIRMQNTSLKPEVLEEDRKVVVAVLPELRRHFRDAGLPEMEANDAAMSTWYEARVGAQAVTQYRVLTGARLLSIGQEMGMLNIESTPDRAAVTVNGRVWRDPTRASRYMPYGEVTIVLSKTGFSTVTKHFKVDQIKNDFSATLSPEPPKKP